jgi:predicted DNA binding CopG/RHH family protein
MTPKSLPKFANEAEEAQWWYERRDQLTAQAQENEARKELHLHRLPVSPGESSLARNITIRVAEQDLARARNLAAKRGLRYQTYLKMLLHEALDAEEKKLAS